MTTLRITGFGLAVALATLAACANDGLVGEQDDAQAGDGDGDGDGDENVAVDCPEAPPADGAPCGQEGASCAYDDCVEPISKATCADGNWVTEADGCPAPFDEVCPDGAPAEGDPCSPDSVDVCTYDCASGLPADHGLEARCTDVGVFALNDDACQLCGGAPNPAGCSAANPCADGQACRPYTGDACLSSACTCDEAAGTWSCTPDCLGGECVPAGECSGAYPGGCSDEHPCPDGFECLPPPPPGGGGDWECTSSGCTCDTGTGTWSCLPDCGGSRCVPSDEVACAGTHNPQGCSAVNPCAEGLSCMVPLEPVCLPSSCTCNAEGGWDCVEDCGGGECR